MPSTSIADVIVPEVFAPYVVNKSAELSAFWQSGIVAPDPRVEAGGPRKGGETINMPFWNDLDGEEETLSDQRALTVSRISAGQDVAVLQAVGKAWGVNDLAVALAGDDPMRAIADSVAGFWERRMQIRLLSIIRGAFGASGMSESTLDISSGTGAAAVIDKHSFADAMAKLGDASAGLTAVAMHSATYWKLYKDDLLDNMRGADGAESPTYQGRRVIVDDNMYKINSTGVYHTYLFGPGAFAYAEGTPKVAVETDRDSLAGKDVLVHRRHFVLHPRGVKWVGTATVSTGDATSSHPSHADLASGANWERVYEQKQIRMVRFIHKLAA